MKRLKDGEVKEVKSRRNAIFKTTRMVGVLASRVDCDTPYVHLSVGSSTVMLTDVDVDDLIDRLGRALEILPTSK